MSPYYIGARKDHTILTSPSFYTEDSGGILFSGWVRAMLEEDSRLPWENAECKSAESTSTAEGIILGNKVGLGGTESDTGFKR